MRKLDRHIATSVLLAILAVLGVLFGLSLLFAFIDELSDLRGEYQLKQALLYVGMTSPRHLAEMLPMAALIGCLVGLGTLASHSELTVMRAAGLPLGRILWAVIKPLLLLMLVGLLIAEYLAPWSEATAQANRSAALASVKAQSSKHGMWHRQGNEFIHINTVRPNGVLLGVTRYLVDGEKLVNASFARQATYHDGYWQLEDVTRTKLYDSHTVTEAVASERWEVKLSPQLLNTVVMAPDALPISGLWSYSVYLIEQGLDAGSYRLAFWSKLLQPLITGVLVLMAISFIFGPLRSVTLGQRVFTGVVVGFVFRIVQDLLGPASLIFGFSPLLAVLTPAAICAVIGIVLLRRAG